MIGLVIATLFVVFWLILMTKVVKRVEREEEDAKQNKYRKVNIKQEEKSNE